MDMDKENGKKTGISGRIMPQIPSRQF